MAIEKKELPSPQAFESFEFEDADLPETSKRKESPWWKLSAIGLSTATVILICTLFLIRSYERDGHKLPAIATKPGAAIHTRPHTSNVQSTSSTVWTSSTLDQTSTQVLSSHDSESTKSPTNTLSRTQITKPAPITLHSIEQGRPTAAAPSAATRSSNEQPLQSAGTEPNKVDDLDDDTFAEHNGYDDNQGDNDDEVEDDIENPDGTVLLDAEKQDATANSSTPVTKAVIGTTGKGKEDLLDWMITELPGWQSYRYAYDGHKSLTLLNASEGFKAKQNWGRESNTYLTYIVDNYEKLPDYMVFVHGKRWQTHNDDPMYDTVPEIMNLNLSYLDEHGYVSLRCSKGNGCPKPYLRPKLDHKDGFWEFSGFYAKTHLDFFPDLPVPPEVGAPCCAQFAVSKKAVRAIPRKTWRYMLHYVWKQKWGLPGEGSMKIGLVMEYMWHIIFGKPPMYCDHDIRKCYCEKWGICNIKKKSCTDIRCKGRLWPPPSTKFPDGWPEKGQGGAWPKEGWWNDSKYLNPELARRSEEESAVLFPREPYPFDLPHSSFDDCDMPL